MRNIFERVARFSLESQETREKYQLYYIFIIIGSTLVFMSLVNIYAQEMQLLISTIVGGIACYGISLYIKYAKYNREVVNAFIYFLLILASTYFIVLGGDNGFGMVWVLIMPSTMMIVLGIKNGTFLSIIIFVELIFFNWTDIGRSILAFEYNESVLMRFPVAFFAAYFISLYLEYERRAVFNALKKEKDSYFTLSRVDPLTGVYNRLGFNQIVDELLKNKEKEHIALLIADLDYFKEINDEHGHAVGDIVLKKLAAKMKTILNEDTSVCRWGGEEFAIFLYGKENVNNCELIAHSLRKVIEEEAIVVNEKNIFTTLSIGYACTVYSNNKSKEELFLKADDCLYKAKEMGRNTVIGTHII